MRFLLIILFFQALLAQAEVLDDVVGSKDTSAKAMEFEFFNHPIEHNSPYVLLGDIAKCKAAEDVCLPYLAYLIAITPELGKTVSYTDNFVLEILNRAFPNDLFKFYGRSIQVTAAKGTMREDEKAAVTKVILDEIHSINKEMSAKNQRLTVDKIILPANWIVRKAEKTFKLENMNAETLKTKYATLRIEYSEEFEAQVIQVPVHTTLEFLLPLATNSLTNNHVLKAEDFELNWIKSNQSFLGSKSFVNSPSDLVGKAVRGYIQKGQPIAQQMVNEPIAILRGQTVTLLLQSGEILLRAKAQAVEQGSIGQTIEVTNALTKKRMRAKVVNHESVMAI